LRSAFKNEKLNLIIGTMYSDGYVKYVDSEIKIENLEKDEE